MKSHTLQLKIIKRTSDPGSYLTLNKSERAPNGSEKYVKEKRTVKNAVSHMYASV